MNDLFLPPAASPSNDPGGEVSAPSLLEPNLSGQGFAIGLYLEHLEEASFLYEQRLDLLDDPELTWLDLDDFEARFEAHIDALVLGETLALAVCRQQAREGDFGEAHAAARVFCRQDRLDLVQEMLDSLDPADDDGVKAVSDALCQELPEGWTPTVIQMLGDVDAVRRRLAVRIAGYRRLEAGEALLQMLPTASPKTLPEVVWALGRLRYLPARVPLYERGLHHEDPSVRRASALALLRLGEPHVVQYCLSRGRAEPWALLPVGLAGSHGCLPRLLELTALGQASAEGLLALGLLGDVSAVNVLLGYLTQEELGEAAATALYLITGAPLYEDIVVPDELEEEALFDDELEKLRRGEPLTPPAETPPGETRRRLSQQPEAWQAWWMNNESRFQASLRYRNGQLYSPACLLENLTSAASPHRVRRWASDELAIRYGMKLPFETDMTVAQQRRLLKQGAAWWEAKQTSLQEGKWYFAGTPAVW